MSNISNIDRRKFVAAAGIASVVPLAALATQPTDPIVGLLARYKQVYSDVAAVISLEDPENLGTYPKDYNAACEIKYAIRAEISDAKPQTMEGLIAKLEYAVIEHGPDWMGLDSGNLDGRLLLSILAGAKALA